AEEEIAEKVEAAISRGQGRFAGNAADRRALERYGVRKAMAHFTKQGFAVEDVGSSRSYDVSCTKKDAPEMRVEGKATSTLGEQLVLTPRETTLTGDRTLFIVHSIKMKRGKPSGGTVRIITPWTIAHDQLKAISYLYTLP